MSGDEINQQLMRLFQGVIASVNSTILPAGTEPMGLLTALNRAMIVVYRNGADDVREALRRVEAGLPNQRDYPDGQIDLSEYNRRVISIIQDETAKLQRLEAELESVLSEMDEIDRRY